ncbi:hypothetical protein [Clostridium ljungdahlii]|uniref:Uncharacterized protein n=1 Tax=Clostridium ljungdahlii (strain ATCC 55383 / DSM 13528 / PETC) TaxID=748727 RepID=D8GSX4_CLOLD|nr:hypothetical protein [Clostridium ljungdahlii]ADK14544.1 hypothetical protein CLJU_c14760 [Clostridium ljungdahlii DSM 13528]OAA88039.1 hypothetical protein WX45_02906 [Clostridium ljungdahlii DSM 13528]
MTPMSNNEYLSRLQFSDELKELETAKKASGLNYEQLAQKIGVNKVWLDLDLKVSSGFLKNTV